MIKGKRVKKNGKLWGIFFISMMFIILYCFLVPRKENAPYKYYTNGIFLIIYMTITVFSAKNISIKKVSRKKILMAAAAGVLGSMVTTTGWVGILSGVCTFFACLYCFCINAVYEKETEIIKDKRKNYILDDIRIIFIGLAVYLIILYFTLLSYRTVDNSASIGVTNIFTSMGAGVSEEIIFRWFLWSFMVQINKGEEISDSLYYSMVLIPFSLLHVIDTLVLQGITMEAFSYVIRVLFVAFPLAILVKKRDVFVAIVLHFIFDFIKII